MNILIKGGRVIDPGNGVDDYVNLLIKDGKIAKTGKNIRNSDVEQLDATGKVIAPGLVDMHVHLREPGQEYKEDIVSGTRAAVAGGFTSICCMPNTLPPVHDRAIVEYILETGQRKGSCRVYPAIAISHEMKHDQLTEFADLQAAGAVAVSDDGYPVQNSAFLRRAMEYASMLHFLMMLHPEDKTLSEGGAMNEGYQSTILGLKGIPREAEEIMLMRNLLLVKKTGCRTHFHHLSTATGVELLRKAKADGLPVTAEACPHHFSLIDSSVSGYDTSTKINPPLRTDEDVEAVIEGLRDGTIDAIATDHAPHAIEDKEVEYDRAPFGAIGLETALGVTLTHLVKPGRLSLVDAISKLTDNPARILGLAAGTLSVGSPADLVVFDPEANWQVTDQSFFGKSKNSPYIGKELTGRVERTLVAGRVAFSRS